MNLIFKIFEYTILALPQKVRWRLLRGGFSEYAYCLLLKPRRLNLPKLSLEVLLPDYRDAPVTLSRLPKGDWASPVVDVVVMAKLMRTLQPQTVLELGSFRGFTALAMAQNMPESSRLVAVDMEPKHGEAYSDRPESSIIERRTGQIERKLFRENEFGIFDLVFIDADHRYEAVKHDTEIALQLLKPDGWIVWHDYANWGYFSGACGVPEYLAEFKKTHSVAQILGSNMAVHRPCWGDSAQAEFEDALAHTESLSGGVWSVGVPRA